MDIVQYHTKYPIGSRWLLPVTVEAHIEPPHDDYDPRPIKLAYKPDAGALYPRCRDLPELIPAAEQTADPHLLSDLLDYAAHLRFTQPPHHKRTLALIERAVSVLKNFDQ